MRNSPLIFVILLSLYLLANHLSNFEKDIKLGIPSIAGFEEVQRGVFKAVNAPDMFHTLNIPIALSTDEYYRIRYDVHQLPRGKVIVTTDFYASGYDHAEQDLTKVFGMDVLGKHQDYIVNLGQSPEHALFRLFYSGSPDLEVANVHITHIATWWVGFKRLLFASTLGAFLILTLFAIQKYRNFAALPQQGENTILRFMTAELPAVFAVYFSFVLMRYLMYIVLPYSGGDEYLYKSIAAGIWHFGSYGILTDTMFSIGIDLPNLLYPYLISPAFMLGENFYVGIRFINAIVINMAIFPSYLIARKYIERKPALIASSFAIAIPNMNIGAFANTEVLFFPLFILSMWLAIESIERKNSILWSIGYGLILAVLLNVRPTGMVLLPAYLVSLFWVSLQHKNALELLKRPYWLVVVVTFLCSYIALKYSLDGRSIGEMGIYSGIAEKSSGPLSIIINNPTGIFHLIVGHMTTLAIPYGLPIALMIFALASSRNKSPIDSKLYDFVVIATVFSAALFALAFIFTISVSLIDVNGLGRWHSRYYFYFYPLVIIAGTVFATRQKPLVAYERPWIVAIVGLLIMANIYFIKLHNATQIIWFGAIADNMDVHWYRHADQFYWFFVLFTAVLLWLWCKRYKRIQTMLVLFMISWIVVANYGTLHTAKYSNGTISNSCGRLGQLYLDQNPGRFIIVGDQRHNMIGAAFWNPYTPEQIFLYSEKNKPLMPDDVKINAEILIVNGEVAVDPSFTLFLKMGQCSIYGIPK